MAEHREPPLCEDDLIAAARGICMASDMSGIDRRLAVALLYRSEKRGFAVISMSDIARDLGVTEGRIIGAIRRLSSRGLIRNILQPDLTALAALWTAPPDYDDRQGDDEEV